MYFFVQCSVGIRGSVMRFAAASCGSVLLTMGTALWGRTALADDERGPAESSFLRAGQVEVGLDFGGEYGNVTDRYGDNYSLALTPSLRSSGIR